MKAEFTRQHAPKYDYTGAHVVDNRLGRHLLGTIRDIYSDETGLSRCRVQHFNGDWWPFDPWLCNVEILERTYEKEAA